MIELSHIYRVISIREINFLDEYLWSRVRFFFPFIQVSFFFFFKSLSRIFNSFLIGKAHFLLGVEQVFSLHYSYYIWDFLLYFSNWVILIHMKGIYVLFQFTEFLKYFIWKKLQTYKKVIKREQKIHPLLVFCYLFVSFYLPFHINTCMHTDIDISNNLNTPCPFTH